MRNLVLDERKKKTMSNISDARPLLTAEEERAEAAKAQKEANESWDRSDTDGFVSQWASGITSQLHAVKARIAEQGGVNSFPALFDLEGNLVPAKHVEVNDYNGYGTKMIWLLLDSDDPKGPAKKLPNGKNHWFSPSQAQKEETRRKNDAKKGFYVGEVLAPANAATSGSGHGLSGALTVGVSVFRTDGGFSRDVTIVDNGIKSTYTI